MFIGLPLLFTATCFAVLMLLLSEPTIFAPFLCLSLEKCAHISNVNTSADRRNFFKSLPHCGVQICKGGQQISQLLHESSLEYFLGEVTLTCGMTVWKEAFDSV